MVVAEKDVKYAYVQLERDRGLPSYVDSRKLERILGENSLFALEKKYLLRNDKGELIETPAEAIYRMSKTMANVEKQYEKSDEEVDQFTKQFYDIISNGLFSPAGRIWTNAGTDIKGLFNCYVLPVRDSLEEIYESVKKAAIIHKNGGGTGYNFSELRPRGTYIKKSKGIASGVVSFVGQFDKETEVINSGNRRGANMGILDINHPDVMDFIYAKSIRGEITNFNVSVGVYDFFMKAVENEDYYDLEFPRGMPFTHEKLESIIKNIEENKVGGAEVGKKPKPASFKFDTKEVIPGKTKVIDTQSDQVTGRVNEKGTIQLYAPYVLDKIAELAWKTADPGMIFLDQINKYNPLPHVPLMATNPCGEQPLHPYDACNLGSIILSNFVKEENGTKTVDYEKLEDTVKSATRFMDNVNDANKGPIEEIEKTVLNNRRIGMGVMGWADMLVKLGIPYDSKQVYDLARKVMGFITAKAKETSRELALEKGVFPAFEKSIYNNGNPEERVRNIQRTTIAPTGTISMVYDISSGIEPFFAVTFRKKIRGGDTLLYTIPAFVKECERRGLDLEKIVSLIEKNHGSVQGIKEVPEDMQEVFKTSHDLAYEVHIKTQAAFQEVTDNAISKTINMRNDSTVEDVKDAYFMAWKQNLKGVTVYRDGSKDVQVLETGHFDNKKRFVPDKVPDMLPSFKIRQNSPFGTIHATFVYEPKTLEIKENFAQLGKGGEVANADLEAICRLSSLIYRAGGNEDIVIDQLEGIGSNLTLPSREGQITSLATAYAKALRKFKILKEGGFLEKILKGEVDPQEVSRRISDMIREGNGYMKSSHKGNKPQGEIYGAKCPDCGGNLIFQEGCTKCSSCLFSKC